MNELPALSTQEITNNSINPRILKIIGGQDKWEELCVLYKERQLKSNGRTPQLIPLFKEAGLTQRQYTQVLGLIGDTSELHKALNQPTKLQLPALMALYEDTVAQLRKRIGEATTKELVEMLKVMPELFGVSKPATQIQVNNSFDINKHLAERNIIIDKDK